MRHCISHRLEVQRPRSRPRPRPRPRGSYRQTMFYSPVAFSRASGGYQDRPSPVNNQIRSARKSLLLAKGTDGAARPGDKVPRNAGFGISDERAGPGTPEPIRGPVKRTANSRGSASRTFELAPTSNSAIPRAQKRIYA